jgi:hypothetical protein
VSHQICVSIRQRPKSHPTKPLLGVDETLLKHARAPIPGPDQRKGASLMTQHRSDKDTGASTSPTELTPAELEQATGGSKSKENHVHVREIVVTKLTDATSPLANS